MVCTTSRWGAWLRDTKLGLAKALGKLPDGPPGYPPLTTGMIIPASPGAGSYFPQLVSREGLRLDDVLGPGMWLIACADLEESRLAPFAAELRDWLSRQQAEAVLVRPDRYSFGTGPSGQLMLHWDAALNAGERSRDPS